MALQQSEAETHASQTRLQTHTLVNRALRMSSMTSLRALVRILYPAYLHTLKCFCDLLC